MQHTIDAKNKILGRLASEIALILQGKNHSSYAPNKQGNDSVLIKNASQVKVSGNKSSQKVYHYHTGYMGHLRTRTYKQMKEKQPERILEWAVYNMLPKNFLRQKRMNRLKIEK